MWDEKVILIYFISLKNYENLVDFTVFFTWIFRKYQSTSTQNLLVNNDEKKLLKSDIRPFSKWYKHYFNDIKLDSFSYGGVLGIKKDILQHSKEYYEKFLDKLSSHSNPEVGHYIERTWSKIINPSQSSSKIMLYLIFLFEKVILKMHQYDIFKFSLFFYFFLFFG